MNEGERGLDLIDADNESSEKNLLFIDRIRYKLNGLIIDTSIFDISEIMFFFSMENNLIRFLFLSRERYFDDSKCKKEKYDSYPSFLLLRFIKKKTLYNNSVRASWRLLMHVIVSLETKLLSAHVVSQTHQFPFLLYLSETITSNERILRYFRPPFNPTIEMGNISRKIQCTVKW